jgi:DNA gyrase subunit A
VVVRGKAEIETMKNGRERIIVTEIPYQVNKAQLIQKTYELMADKKMEGISEIRDESDRDGMRIVYELKRDVIPNIVLNQLYTYTSLQTSFGINNVCLDKGRPKLLNLKDMLQLFIDFRMDVLIRRTKFELAEAEKRAHILEGLLIAIDNLDAVIKLIRASETPDEALKGLMEKFKLSELQGRAILDMTLRRLTGLERDKIKQEYKELMAMIDEYNKILRDEAYRFKLIKDEMLDIKERYGDERRTQIVRTTEDINIEDLIPEEDVVITISRLGYLKRTSLTSYRRQNRGGKGAIGGSAREEDFIEYLFVASTHNYMLLFTEKGRCYWLKVYEIPEANKTAKGRAIQNLINMPSDDKIKAFINVKNLTEEEYLKNNFIIFCTKNGVVKKTTLEDYSNPRASGINAISIRDNDHLMEVKMTTGTSEVVIAVKSGKAIRFNESNVRAMGRTAAGVRGINLDSKNDEVVGMVCLDKDDKTATIMVVSEKGYGKRTDLDEYRVIHRGGKGVKTLNVTPKTGKLIAIKDVTDDNDLMIINKSGVTIRMAVKDIKVQGRNTQGVRLIKLNDTDEIAAVAKINEQPEVSGGDEGEGDDQGDMFKDKDKDKE